MAERRTGTVTRWGDRGFGFVRVDGTGAEIFLHARECRGEDIGVGDRVSFVIATDHSGRPQATKAQVEKYAAA
jgi:cold shock CspA family protein